MVNNNIIISINLNITPPSLGLVKLMKTIYIYINTHLKNCIHDYIGGRSSGYIQIKITDIVAL